ncbi:hypothetical protein D2Q93_12735 [Alicyclobacillaceae bacterium I2511]|jgi:putative transposase|nr:hypothetical protein D2Q93_12735 [Alicyclobacillaceae bacterium I2511]
MAMKKHYTAVFKAQLVLELLKEEKTISQISSEYGVHFTMIHRWKNTAIEKLSTVFEAIYICRGVYEPLYSQRAVVQR